MAKGCRDAAHGPPTTLWWRHNRWKQVGSSRTLPSECMSRLSAPAIPSLQSSLSRVLSERVDVACQSTPAAHISPCAETANSRMATSQQAREERAVELVSEARAYRRTWLGEVATSPVVAVSAISRENIPLEETRIRFKQRQATQARVAAFERRATAAAYAASGTATPPSRVDAEPCQQR